MDKHVNFFNFCHIFFVQLTNEPHMSHVMLNFDYKVKLSLLSFHIHSPSQTMKVGVTDIFVTLSICIGVKHLLDEMIMLLPCL